MAIEATSRLYSAAMVMSRLRHYNLSYQAFMFKSALSQRQGAAGKGCNPSLAIAMLTKRIN